MEMLLDLAVQFWQFTVLGILILIGFAINQLDKTATPILFHYKELPSMKPLRIPTSDKGFWGAIMLWLLGSRQWEITKDWHFSVHGAPHVIPKGFQFDGASVPKFLATFLSPVGVLLVGGLVHDYIYKHRVLLKKDKTVARVYEQKEADQLFRDIGISVNGFVFMNYLAYYALRLAGFVAWTKHRRAEEK